MDKEYEKSARFETYISGPDSMVISQKLINTLQQLEDSQNKISTMLMSFNQQEVKPKINTEEKKEKK